MNNHITVVWRADFSGPKAQINPGGFKLPGAIGVEIRKFKGSWCAFRPGTPHQFTEITAQVAPDTARGQVKIYFEKQVTPWEMFELDAFGKAIPLRQDEISWDSKGRMYRKETKQA